MCNIIGLSSLTARSSSEDDVILSTLALPSQTVAEGFTEAYSQEDHDSEEKTPSLEGLEEESSQSFDVTANDWLPKKKPGQKKK